MVTSQIWLEILPSLQPHKMHPPQIVPRYHWHNLPIIKYLIYQYKLIKIIQYFFILNKILYLSYINKKIYVDSNILVIYEYQLIYKKIKIKFSIFFIVKLSPITLKGKKIQWLRNNQPYQPFQKPVKLHLSPQPSILQQPDTLSPSFLPIITLPSHFFPYFFYLSIRKRKKKPFVHLRFFVSPRPSHRNSRLNTLPPVYDRLLSSFGCYGREQGEREREREQQNLETETYHGFSPQALGRNARRSGP